MSDQDSADPWIECSDRLPNDFDPVVFDVPGLGSFVGSLYKGVWRVYTPLSAPDGRRIMIELDGREHAPKRWMPLPDRKS